MHLTRRTLLLLIVLLASVCGMQAVRANDFTIGDLYLLTASHPDPLIYTGIMRIIPETGEVSTLAEVDLYAGNFSYDPWRDRLLGSQGAGTGGLLMVDAAGTVTALSDTMPTPFLVEPRGDGILYAYFSRTGNFGYIDASNELHDLLNESGTGPYTLGNLADPTELHYDWSTNSLLVFGGTSSDIPGCADDERSCVLRIPLTADGTQVSGPIETEQADISSSWELVVGASRGPGNSVIWVVDTNSNEQEPRIQILDPASMISSTYASNGSYTGAASTNAGSYSGRLDGAVILDTFSNYLRAFSQGSAGSGTIIAEEVSTPGNAGETARLIEIRPSPFSTAAEPAITVPHILSVAFPNPFSGTTRLSVDLGSASRITLCIYDVAGRRVRVLADRSMPQGMNAFQWDGHDSEGHPVPSGIYFARLTAGSVRESRKLIVNR